MTRTTPNGASETPPGALVRRLIRTAERACLATALARSPAGWPYASLVLAAADHEAAPLLLISELADHSRNIAADPRVSLLFDGTAGLADPLTGPRATVLGRAERIVDEALLRRYVRRHPGAEVYAGFADFHLYRVVPERAHLVAGFGVVRWLPARDFLYGAVPGIAAAEEAFLDRVNAEHGADVERAAARLPGSGGGRWRVVGLDAEGVDLRCEGRLGRLDFAFPATDAETALAELRRLATAAGDGGK